MNSRDRSPPRLLVIVAAWAFTSALRAAQVVTTGPISAEPVSTMFQPTGSLRQPRSVALTFDDGPSPIDTPRILSILRRFHVRATFFTIGYLVQRYPDIVRREQRMGM